MTLSTDGAQAAELLLAEVRRLPIEESSTLSFDLLHVAATLKLEHGVPYVDAIAGAWAIRNSALFATTDRRGFRKAASAQALDVRFIR